MGILEETDRHLLADEMAAETVDLAVEADDPDLGVVARLWPRRYVRRRLAELLAARERAQAWATWVGDTSPEALLAAWRALAEGPRAAAQGRVLHLPEAAVALEEVGGWDPLIDALTTRAGAPRKRLRPAWEALALRVSEERDALRLRVGPEDALLAELLPSGARLARRAMGRYDAECERRRQLDFDSLQRLAAGLVRARADVRAQVRARYDEVFVDEAQDTSPLQWSLILAIGADEDGRLPRRGFFAVGDAQQSIYGFRGARPDDFRGLGREMVAGGGRQVRLATSYRMRPAPLALTNHLAAALFEEPEVLEAGRPAEGDAGDVELALTDDAGSVHERTERLAELVVARISARLDARSLRPQDAALLLRSRTQLSVWEDALWRGGLPFVTAGGVGFFQRREVLDLCALLAFLHDPRDDIALATILRAPLFSVSDVALFRLKAFRRGGLWRALRDAANTDGADPGDSPLAFAVSTLTLLRSLAGRVPGPCCVWRSRRPATGRPWPPRPAGSRPWPTSRSSSRWSVARPGPSAPSCAACAACSPGPIGSPRPPWPSKVGKACA